MQLQNKTASIANCVLYCRFCHPMSGCILSDLKGKQKGEIYTRLKEMSEKALDRIISYHQSCPYREKLMV